MQRYLTPLIGLTFALLLGGCTLQPIQPETPAASTPEATQEMATEQAVSTPAVDLSDFSAARLANLAYQVENAGDEPIQLTDGLYQDEPNRIRVDWINTYALGELNGEAAAAVILESSGGGSGTFKTLHVVTEQADGLVNVGSTLIGDRVGINSILIVDNEIVLDIVAPGPDEPMCCGTQRSLNRYTLQAGEIVTTTSVVIGVQEPISATAVITFTPQVIPDATQAGNCFANSISVNRADAWRCMTGNLIHDPCFQVDDTPTVVCGIDPFSEEAGFVLELTEPLPAVEVYESDRSWLIQLADGTICGMMTGTVPGADGQVAPYGCADDAQSYLMEEFNTEFPVWFAQDVTFDLGENGFSIRSSVLKPIAKVWR